MDPQSLFKKTNEPASQGNARIIGSGNALDDFIMVDGLSKSKYNIRFAGADQRFSWIKEGSVDIGFISAIDFATLKGGWKVFPNICKSSFGASKRSLLFFNKYLKNIDSIAISPAARTSKTALKIVLKERYQIDCYFKDIDDNLSNLLTKYDAVLLTGDQALENAEQNYSFIDLSEKWSDMTGLPLVYGFWIGNELLSTEIVHNDLKKSLKLGIEHTDEIIEKHALNASRSLQQDFLTRYINFNFDEKVQAGLDELYRYAFFYGLTKYIPDFNFLDDSEK